MHFQEIVAPTITELFETQLQTLILSGQMIPGEKLPTEAEMAAEMNVSKSAVHQGVKNLERMGFLSIIPRHGIYVADYTECGNVDTLMALLKHHGGRLDKHTATSLLEARSALEGLAMERFIRRCTKEDIVELETIIEQFRERGANQARPAELAEYACSFHRYICFKSGNNVVPLIVNAFHDVNIALWTLWVTQAGVDSAIETLQEFLTCIKAKDIDKAVSLFDVYAERFLTKTES